MLGFWCAKRMNKAAAGIVVTLPTKTRTNKNVALVLPRMIRIVGRKVPAHTTDFAPDVRIERRIQVLINLTVTIIYTAHLTTMALILQAKRVILPVTLY